MSEPMIVITKELRDKIINFLKGDRNGWSEELAAIRAAPETVSLEATWIDVPEHPVDGESLPYCSDCGCFGFGKFCSECGSRMTNYLDFGRNTLCELPQPVAHVQSGDVDLTGQAHELWALSQLTPGEGIEDGVARIQNYLTTTQSAPVQSGGVDKISELEIKNIIQGMLSRFVDLDVGIAIKKYVISHLTTTQSAPSKMRGFTAAEADAYSEYLKKLGKPTGQSAPV